MAKEEQNDLIDEEKSEILSILERNGKEKWFKRWKEHMAIPNNLEVQSEEKLNRERVIRYLLLRTLINQQAKFEKVRELCIRLSEKFGDTLFFKSYEIPEKDLFKVFREVAGERGSSIYRVGALGGIKPISLFAYRFKAYEGFIREINHSKQYLIDICIKTLKKSGPFALFDLLNRDSVLSSGWVGNDPKACRMFVNWVVFLFNEIWGIEVSRMENTLMIVDGHVGKIFCRTGMLKEVLYESKRPYIIQASKMREKIEEIVEKFGKIPFYVDNGAFYLFEDGYCLEIEPKCSKCPIRELCKKYLKWTAYQRNLR